MSDRLDSELIEQLKRSAMAASDWHHISGEIRGPERSEAANALAAAFDYMLTVHRGEGRQSPASFDPMVAMEDGYAYPPPLSEVDDGWKAIWAEAAEAVQAPAAQARLHDLLAEVGHEEPRRHAQAAVDAYRALAGGDWNPLDRSEHLVRALELARKFGDGDRADLVLADMLRFVGAELDHAEPAPGIVVRLLRSLVFDRDCPNSADELLARAREQFSGAHILESLIELQRHRAGGDPERLSALARERVQAWLDEADEAGGLVRVVRLETAARLARDAGERDLLERAQQLLQQVPHDELELTHISEEVVIPEDVVDQVLAPFTGAQTVDDALAALISFPPLTGDVNENREAVARSRVEFPLQHLFPRIQLGGDGLPRWSPVTDDDRDSGELARQELLRMQIVGRLLARGLWQTGHRLHPEAAEVEAFVESLPNTPPGGAKLIARAFDAFMGEDWESSLFIVLPLIEAMCRQLVLAMGRGIYQTQRGRQPGKYPGLGVLLRWMRDEGFDESWYRYLLTSLASPEGLNLRNEVAHGFVTSVPPDHAAAALHIAVFLAALSVRMEEDPGESAV